MQTKYGEYVIYRNKPSKLRHYLQQKQPYLNQIIKSIQKAPAHRSLEKHNNPLDHLSNRQLKSSLVQLINRTRKRVNTERSLAENALNSSLNIKKIKNNSLKVDEKVSNEKTLKKSLIIRTSVECEEGSPRKKDMLSYRYPSILASANEKRKQTMDYSGKKKSTMAKSSESKLSEKMLNFRPKGKSLYKMSVHNLGQKKEKEQFIKGFKKEEKLGKGGFSVVWSARHLASDICYAVKEMEAYNKYQTHLAQIAFTSFFFEKGKPKPEFANHPGIDGLLTMYSYHLSGEKVFLVYEKCTAALGEFLFDIYEQTDPPRGGQNKGFIIVHKALYDEMRTCTKFLKRMVYQLAQTLDLLSKCNLVHSDIKTSNILITLSPDELSYSFKLVDYGSSFFFQNLQQYRLATPEYIPPELVNFLNYSKGKPHDEQLLGHVKDYHNISAIDIWGLGCVILQIVHGVPLWLNSQVSFKIDGVSKVKSGIFATDKRTYAQILERELNLIDNIDRFLIEENNTKVLLDGKLKQIVKGCLELDPSRRMRPGQIVNLLEGEIY